MIAGLHKLVITKVYPDIAFWDTIDFDEFGITRQDIAQTIEENQYHQSKDYIRPSSFEDVPDRPSTKSLPNAFGCSPNPTSSFAEISQYSIQSLSHSQNKEVEHIENNSYNNNPLKNDIEQIGKSPDNITHA
jgi:hypothetical protein